MFLPWHPLMTFHTLLTHLASGRKLRLADAKELFERMRIAWLNLRDLNDW
jgi:hypothetical protein